MSTIEQKTYRGLCIGGPADGQIKECKHDWFFAIKPLGEKNYQMVSAGDPVPEADPASVSQRYKYLPVIKVTAPKSEEKFAFWIPEDKGMDFIFRNLITSYERKRT